MTPADNAQAALAAVGAAGNAKQAAPGKGDSADLRAVAEEFEAVFMAQMAAQMFTEVGDGPFSGGAAEQNYRTMLYQEFGKAIAKAGGVGIADAVMREMIRIQEGGAQ